jgi:hypothetical protein
MITMNRRLNFQAGLSLVCCAPAAVPAAPAQPQPAAIVRMDDPWKQHIVYEGAANSTAVAADFTGDGAMDVITSAGGAIRLLTGPHWTESVIHRGPRGPAVV